uniref:Uncharacterized protein n=1 Tax=Glossina brevipalpis TaxID=37001 RepID=A0A1A9WTU4_9MUSC
MKLLLIIVSTAVALVTAKFDVRTKADALQAHEDCHEEYNIPDDIYEQYLNYQFPEHKYTNCYVKCWIEKMGIFTENKGFNEKNIIAQYTHEDTKNLGTIRHGLEKCIDHNEWDSDTCTWANRVFSCWLKVNRHVVRKMFT